MVLIFSPSVDTKRRCILPQPGIGCATCNAGPEAHALDKLEVLIERMAHRYSVRTLARCAHALARMNQKADMVFEAVAWQVERKSGKLQPEELSNMLWAFVQMGHANSRLLKQVEIYSS